MLLVIDIWKQDNIQQKSPITNLTRTEEALLSPTEKVIASKTT